MRVLETGRRCWVLAVRVVETGCRVLGARCWVLCGRRELACRCLVLVPASDSEVITTASLTVKGDKTPFVAVKGDQPPLLTMKCQQSWAA